MKFQLANGTVFSGWLDQAVPDHQVPSSARKYEINKGKQITATSLPLLLALELLHESEVETSDLLGEDDDITLFNVASSYNVYA